MLASGGAPAEVVPQLLAAQTGFALQAQNYAAAEAPLTRLSSSTPTMSTGSPSSPRSRSGSTSGRRPHPLSPRAAAQRGERPARAGIAVPAALAIAYEGHMVAPALELSRALVTAYPTAENWRTAFGIYRDLAGQGGGTDLDVGRLMRAAGVADQRARLFPICPGGQPRRPARRGQGGGRGRPRPQRLPGLGARRAGDAHLRHRPDHRRPCLAGAPAHPGAGGRRRAGRAPHR